MFKHVQTGVLLTPSLAGKDRFRVSGGRKGISRERIENALVRILASEEFRLKADRSRFLEYIVTETLEGRSDRIKGYAIAVEVYGRDTDFDPQSDPIVRVEARKLRRDLEHYYLTSGSDDEIRIDIPKGSYVPTFEFATEERHVVEKGNAAPQAPGSGHDTNSPWTFIITARMALPIGVALIALLLVAGLITWRGLAGDPEVDANIAGPTLFVFPFEGSSGDPKELSLAKGVTIELVSTLSQFAEIQVYPVGAAIPISEIVSELRNDSGRLAFVLGGNVQLIDKEVRITARLQNAVDGLHIWSERYDGNYLPDQIFGMQEKIASNVARKLAEPFGLLGEISRREIAKTYNPSLKAYQCVLAGYQYRATFSRELHGPARTCLERAVRSDPDYSRAWALLAHVYVDEYRFFYNPRPGAYQRSIDAGRRAVELDPNDALSYQALSIALFGKGEIEAALEAGRKAFELNPQNHEALIQLGYRTYATGKWDEGFALVQEATAKTLSPPAWYPWVTALYHYKHGDYEKAQHEAEAAGLQVFVLLEATRAAIYGQLDMAEKAAASLARVRQQDPVFDERARQWFAAHQFPEDFLDQIMDGLYKAGLTRTDD